jgi:hypothetical protein
VQLRELVVGNSVGWLLEELVLGNSVGWLLAGLDGCTSGAGHEGSTGCDGHDRIILLHQP